MMTNVKLNSLENATAIQKVFANEAIGFIKSVVNHQPFLDAVLAAKYSSARFQPDQGAASHATNEEILQSIVSGKEYKSTADGCVDLKIIFEEYRNDTVVGG